MSISDVSKGRVILLYLNHPDRERLRGWVTFAPNGTELGGIYEQGAQAVVFWLDTEEVYFFAGGPPFLRDLARRGYEAAYDVVKESELPPDSELTKKVTS